MADHLLHIDSSIQGERSVSRALSSRAAQRWRETHPGGTTVYRDLGAEPIPHFTADTGLARLKPAEEHNGAEAGSYALSHELVEEILAADTILLGYPTYNFGPPSTVKAWVDHLIVPGLVIPEDRSTGLLAGRELIVLQARGGGYAEGTPRHGWDHGERWLPHGLALTGLEPRFITADLTLSNTDPAMEHLKPLAAESLAAAEREIDGLWSADRAALAA
jgi:FMN-dependent NADH-azoreductase